jgi:hypothetical protein
MAKEDNVPSLNRGAQPPSAVAIGTVAVLGVSLMPVEEGTRRAARAK